MPLCSVPEMADFRRQWSNLQTGFVDEPRRTAADADNLVGTVMERLAEGFATERSGLEKEWDRVDNVSSEGLRIALQRYRSFFDRLLRMLTAFARTVAGRRVAVCFSFSLSRYCWLGFRSEERRVGKE